MTTPTTYVGIDIAKAKFDAAPPILLSGVSGYLNAVDGGMPNVGCLRLTGLPQIVGCLLGDPGVGAATVLYAEPAFQAQGHLW